VAQDASFITSDPGHARADKPRGDEAQTRRSRDGAWTRKGGKSFFGYKLHLKMDLNHGLIWCVETTAANVHDSRVDLSRPGEVVYEIRGIRVSSREAGTRRCKREAITQRLWNPLFEAHTIQPSNQLKDKN
jgi:IS5 family transposase